jgi:hypothetical protein
MTRCDPSTATTITLTLTRDEARWLATAVTVLRRILQQPSIGIDRSDFSERGLAVLHKLAEMLPSGFYL